MSQNEEPMEGVFSEMSLFPTHGTLGDNPYRRRLFNIQRWITLNRREWSAILSTAQFSNPTVSNYKNIKAKWLPLGTPFLVENTLKQMNEKASQNPPTFQPFQVVIGSLMYVYLPGAFNIVPNKNKYWFHDSHPRQFGAHVFILQTGVIVMCVLDVDLAVPLEKSGPITSKDLEIKEKYRFDANPLHCIHSTYPVLRCEWQCPSPKQVITYGLYYDTFARGKGNRYYHRMREDRLEAGGVYELTPEQFKKFRESNVTEPYIALYVCAGARLIVTDRFQRHKDNPERDVKGIRRNRTLIQQGGVVICKERFLMQVPIRSKKKVDNYRVYESYGWKEYCHKHFVPIDSKLSKAYEGWIQPIIFLGAVDSKYNSIAWYLDVEQYAGPNDRVSTSQKECILMVPMGAHIVAIENGSKGIAEIEARIGYEMLHDSVVIPHNTKFKKPDLNMVKQILNLHSARSIDVKYPGYDILETKQSPKEFNISKVMALRENTDPENPGFQHFYDNQKTRYAVPPMYPPLFHITARNEQSIYFMPSKEKSIKDMDSIYQYEGNHLKLVYDNKEYEYNEKIDCHGYHYLKMDMPYEHSSSYRKYSGHFHDSKAGGCAGSTIIRIGVDGWLWKQVGTHSITKEENICIVRDELSQPKVASGTSSGTSGGTDAGSGGGKGWW